MLLKAFRRWLLLKARERERGVKGKKKILAHKRIIEETKRGSHFNSIHKTSSMHFYSNTKGNNNNIEIKAHITFLSSLFSFIVAATPTPKKILLNGLSTSFLSTFASTTLNSVSFRRPSETKNFLLILIDISVLFSCHLSFILEKPSFDPCYLI